MTGAIDGAHIGGQETLAPLRFVDGGDAYAGIAFDHGRIHPADVSDDHVHANSPFVWKVLRSKFVGQAWGEPFIGRRETKLNRVPFAPPPKALPDDRAGCNTLGFSETRERDIAFIEDQRVSFHTASRVESDASRFSCIEWAAP
jgi:hypothetical protein